MNGAPHVTCDRPWLVARFAAPQRMVSWSLNRPGFVEAESVAWLEVHGSDFVADVDPAVWFAARLAAQGLGDAVGMMTARNVASFVQHTAVVGAVKAGCVVTLGLNNGERVGARMAQSAPGAGTINILCHVSHPLTDAALLEAASIVAQARTVVLTEAGYRRPGQADIVTGTGTDCIVMASPIGGAQTAYAGMHTEIGEAVGACVANATAEALRAWLAERGS
jgi:adenosylcobinamide amidohydrolase